VIERIKTAFNMQLTGAILSHDNMSWNSKSWVRSLDWSGNEVVKSYMPLSHIAGLIMDAYCPYRKWRDSRLC